MNFFEAYRDLWNLHKKYFDVLNTDDYWQSVMQDARQIEQTYKNNKFVLDVLMAIIAELERRAQDEQKVSCISTKSTVAGNKTESV